MHSKTIIFLILFVTFRCLRVFFAVVVTDDGYVQQERRPRRLRKEITPLRRNLRGRYPHVLRSCSSFEPAALANRSEFLSSKLE